MLVPVLISLGFLLLLGLIMIKGSYERLNSREIPKLYQLPTVKQILKLSIFLFVTYAGFFIFYNWKLFLLLLIVGILTARFTTVIFWDIVFSAIFAKTASQQCNKS
ncbi:hypothetical protein JCM14036_26580 [Desulfotomaculum defluvii]